MHIAVMVAAILIFLKYKGDGSIKSALVIFLSGFAVFLVFPALVTWLVEKTQDPLPIFGKVGIATTDLIPNGKISIKGGTVEAVSVDGVISEGEKIQIVSVKAGKACVRRAKT